MGQHLSAVYSPIVSGIDTFEFVRYSFPQFVHVTGDRPGERRLYTKGFWVIPHPARGGAAEEGSVDGYEGLYIPSYSTDESILGVADVALPDQGNVSFVLTNENVVYAILYVSGGGRQMGGGGSDIYLPVQDPYVGPHFLGEMAALFDDHNKEIHALTLVSDNRGTSFIIDWFGSFPYGNDLGSWTVIPLFLAGIPGGRLVAASYSQSLQEREVLVATIDTIKLIRSTKHSTQVEDFASFSGKKIISLTSFSVPDDTAQRAVVATTSDDLTYQLWEIAYERSAGQPLLISTLTNIDPLVEISGYANPTESLRHLAMLINGRLLYRGSYTQSGGGFQYSPWPGVPVAVP